MNDDFDILALLIEEKSRDEVIKDAIAEICLNPITLNTGSGLEYAVNKEKFEKWLIDNGFMQDFEIDDIPLDKMSIAVKQAAIDFVCDCF